MEIRCAPGSPGPGMEGGCGVAEVGGICVHARELPGATAFLN